MAGLIDFSIDAVSNGDGAPPINFVEGQAAASVNNSARALMAALACWRDDTCGGLIATGAAGNLLSLATNQLVRASHFAGAFELSFFVDGANTGPVTLSVDGTTARPVRRQRNLPLGPGDLSPAIIYRIRYIPSLGVFLVVSPEIAPPGTFGTFGSVAAIPPGWRECDGSLVSRSTHAALFASIGNAWGAGDGATTFNLPDTRGRILFGRDGGTGRLTAAGGINGITIGQTGGTDTVTLTAAQIPNVTVSGTTDGAGGHDHGGATQAAGAHNHGGATQASGAHSHTGTTQTGGVHSHTGTTDSAGTHSHTVNYTSASIYGTGGSGVAVARLWTDGSFNAGGVTEGAGGHGHPFTTGSSTGHDHPFTTNGAADHTHVIPAATDHAHGITAAANHTHGFTATSAGGGGAHSNVPPGAVAVHAIKA